MTLTFIEGRHCVFGAPKFIEGRHCVKFITSFSLEYMEPNLLYIYDFLNLVSIDHADKCI